jgi:hypothetical protein
MSSQTIRTPRSWVTPIAVAAALCALQAAVTFPGELTSDSREQLQQAITHSFTDWHPPVMALVWSWLLRLHGGPGSLLLLHQFLRWLGFGLIADGCYRAKMQREAWLVIAAGAFPLFLYYDRIVWKDVGMASALVAGAGIAIWFLVQKRQIPLWAVLLSAICILYGALVRTNAVFAIGSILMLYVLHGRRLGFPTIIACSILVALVAVPLSNWINHRLIGAKPEYPSQSLQIFDLMGIAVHSGDNRVWGENPPPMQTMRDCYTPYWWDPASPWGSCPRLRQEIGYSLNLDAIEPETLARTGRLWREAIVSHPVAYLAHRAEYFNSSIYFYVPSFQFRYSKSALIAPFGERLISQRDIDLDYLKNSFLCWPVSWLCLGVCVLALLGVSATVPVEVAIARLLIMSALLFSGAYLIVGVATDVRYHYWSTMAILLGVVLASRELGVVIRGRQMPVRLAGYSLLLVVLLGYTARIADVRFF